MDTEGIKRKINLPLYNVLLPEVARNFSTCTFVHSFKNLQIWLLSGQKKSRKIGVPPVLRFIYLFIFRQYINSSVSSVSLS